MPDRKIKISLSYDGTDFCGWQIQKKERTIQAVLEEALFKIHKKQVRIYASGRTDSGVHANRQTAHFTTDIDSIPDERIRDALNSEIPRDVRVLKSEQVQNDFHARYDAKIRVYLYNIFTGSVCDPINSRFCYSIKRKPNLNRLNNIAAVLVGEHDFSTFAAAGDSNRLKVRRIFSACFFPDGDFIVFKIAGNAFLWKMVRSIVGTILSLEERGASADEMKFILHSKDRAAAGVTAPAKGLFLNKVIYSENALY